MKAGRLVAGAIAAVSGCGWTQPSGRDVVPPGSLPDHYQPAFPDVAIPPATGARRSGPTSRWWSGLGDPQLDALVERALAGNYELRIFAYRTIEEKFNDDAPRAEMSPQVTLEADASAGRVQFTGGGSLDVAQGRVGAVASYELDVWGRISRTNQSSEALTLIAREEFETIAMTLAATVAETWFAAVEQVELRRILEAQMVSDTEATKFLDARFRQGEATRLAVLQQQQRTAETKVRAAQVELRLEVLQAQLGDLVGLKTGSVEIRDDVVLKEPTGIPDTGLPHELVRQRPDVRREQLRVEEESHRLAAAMADRLPSVQLRASAGLQGFETTEYRWSSIFEAGVVVSFPLLDGGVRSAEVQRMRLVDRRRRLMYEDMYVRAVREVEQAVRLETKQRVLLAATREAVASAEATRKEALMRYEHGLDDYLPVLTATNTLLDLRQREITEIRVLLVYRVRLHRAVGGTWTDSLRLTPQ